MIDGRSLTFPVFSEENLARLPTWSDASFKAVLEAECVAGDQSSLLGEDLTATGVFVSV